MPADLLALWPGYGAIWIIIIYTIIVIKRLSILLTWDFLIWNKTQILIQLDLALISAFLVLDIELENSRTNKRLVALLLLIFAQLDHVNLLEAPIFGL